MSRERLEALFSQMVLKVLSAQNIPGIQNAVHYPITELVTNIFEHSHAQEGYVFGQYYPKKQYLDICLVDRGRGLASTYKEDRGLKFSDSEAIIEVMNGHSVKPNKERGYGVRTSKRVVCEAMGGQFVLVSGSAVLVADGTKQKIGALPNFYWNGVIVAYRIPQPQASIDISPYIE